MQRIYFILTAFLLASTLHFSTKPAWAHCDSMDGPVVLAAKQALSTGDVTPVLKWVLEEDEAEVVSSFNRTVNVRDESEAVREMADTYFFETVVRLHRMSEGVGYTGLKPATSVDPGIQAADIALESGSIDALEQYLLNHVRNALHSRYADAVEALKHADHNTKAGREFVEAYVRYTHLIEGIDMAIAHTAADAGDSAIHAH